MRITAFSIIYFLFAQLADPVQATCGIVNFFGEPLGGGRGYSQSIVAGNANLDANANVDSLIRALNNAQRGQVIFIHGDAEIDFGTTRYVAIPAGVTLASDRGVDRSQGARLYTSSFGGTLLETDGDDIRITGLRIEGPSQTTAVRDSTYGISNNHNDLQVDNCELYGFTFGAIATRGSAIVSHNNIHHNQRHQLGYGVVLYGDSEQRVDIFGNVFNANRHSVAGSGQLGQSYVAHNNLVLWVANGHVFDMHAECEPGQPVYGSPWAGDLIEIRNNYILPLHRPAVTIRGSPSDEAIIVDNFLSRNNDVLKVHRYSRQATWPSGSGEHAGDRYCQEVQDVPLVNYDTDSPSYNCFETALWLIGLGATDHYQILNKSGYHVRNLKFGDFNGDGEMDVFMISEGRWHISWGGRSTWDPVNFSSAQLDSLRIGDFNGDGRADIFRKSGNNWQVSWNARSSWERIGSSGIDVDNLRFGDFNGDGRTDIFILSGTNWRVSFSQGNSMTSWQTVRSFSSNGGGAAQGGRVSNIDELRFGDFNGDGKMDVFSTDGGRWWVSHATNNCNIPGGGCSFDDWEQINSSSYTLENLALADVDGDGKTDILHISSDGRFRAAYGGRGSWQLRGEAPPVHIDTLIFGDFNGDGADDVFYTYRDD